MKSYKTTTLAKNELSFRLLYVTLAYMGPDPCLVPETAVQLSILYHMCTIYFSGLHDNLAICDTSIDCIAATYSY